MTSVRHLRALWGLYIAPGRLERDDAFRAVLDRETDRGLQVAGIFGVAALVGAVVSKIVAAALTGDSMLLAATDLSGVLADKLFVFSFAALFLVVRRLRPSVRVARALVGIYVALVAVELVSDHLLLPGGSFVSAWLSLLLLLTVGTVPFQPIQTAALGAAVTVLPLLPVLASPSVYDLPGEIRRFVFLTLFTFVCTVMSAALYAGRYTQHRTTVRLARFRDHLERRGELLEARSEELSASVERLSKAQTQLVQQEKMVSLGQLTAGVAHELKNPLNFVNNFAQLSEELLTDLDAELREDPMRPVGEALDASGDLLADLRSNAAKIRDHGRRADGIIRSMLAHSRATPGPRRPAKLNTLLDEYVGLAYHGMRAEYSGFNVDLVRDYDPGIGEVEIVPEEVGRVFLNLLDNAFAAVRTREKTGESGFAPRVAVRTREVPEGVQIAIEDNGTGMSADVREKIFEPFFTTKPTGEGTGLGLSLTYEIVVHGHGGTLALDTAEGIGTTFTVTLPRAAVPTPEPAEAPAVA
ncbi:MAG TPA: ATP-binding protein [Rubricoccaceae bacterium]